MATIIPLASIFSFIILTTGRRLHALRKMLALAEAAGLEPLVALLEQAIAHELAARALERQWATQRQGGDRSLARPADRGQDRFLGAFARHLTNIPDVTDDEAMIDAAQTLSLLLFPQGISPVIHQPFIDQHSEVEHILTQLQGPLAPQVATLDLGTTVAKLAALQAAYTDALNTPAEQGISFGQLREARQQGHENMLRVVAMLVVEFGTAELAETFATFMAPIMAQQKAVTELRRQRRPITDVDPDTGEPISDPTEPAPPAPQPEI